jgi:formylglycine-generating enzyme required for sulfatase activity
MVIKSKRNRVKALFTTLAITLGIVPSMTLVTSAEPPVPAPDAGVPHFTQVIDEDMPGVQFEEHFRMIRVEGGTFTLGCECARANCGPAAGCPLDSRPVPNVSVDTFYIGQTIVTQNLWRAVMGNTRLATTSGGFGMSGGGNRPQTSMTWYEANEFLARLYIITGLEFRLATEAEWEFAAKGGNNGDHSLPFAGSAVEADVVATSSGFGGADVGTRAPNNLGLYDMSGNVEEWTWNTWSGSHSGGHNPTGPGGHLHNQKARRGGSSGATAPSTRHVTARQIRSVDGADGGLGLRIALSGDRTSVPDGMLRAREVQRPSMDCREIPNSWRDPRWVTGDDYAWTGGMGMSMPMKLWESGEVTIGGSVFTGGFGGGSVMGQTVGQWYTVNNIGLVIVTNAGARGQLSYIFMDDDLMTVISDSGRGGAGAMMLPGGRLEKVRDTRDERLQTQPTIPDDVRQTPQTLAEESPRDHRQFPLEYFDRGVDDFPAYARGQDLRLLDGATSEQRLTQGWWMGLGMGGTHTYRKDVDPEEFRFIVYQSVPGITDPTRTGNILANGRWYTVNDTLLRVIGRNGYVTEYLYTVSADGNSFSHVSFQAYERGDSRTLTIHPNTDVTGHPHEIPTGLEQSFYANSANGQSTFRQPPLTGLNCSGCSNPIKDCSCPTLCATCKRHVNNCRCSGEPSKCADCDNPFADCSCPTIIRAISKHECECGVISLVATTTLRTRSTAGQWTVVSVRIASKRDSAKALLNLCCWQLRIE